MPIDLAQVDWLYVAVLALFVFSATFVGNLLSFNHRLTAARMMFSHDVRSTAGEEGRRAV